MAAPRPAPSLPLDPATTADWGLAFDPDAGRLTLSPRPPGRDGMALGPVRAGRTVLRLSWRSRPDSLVLRLSVTFGPPIRVVARPRDHDISIPGEVDGVVLGRAEVAFEARADHEVIWRR